MNKAILWIHIHWNLILSFSDTPMKRNRLVFQFFFQTEPVIWFNHVDAKFHLRNLYIFILQAAGLLTLDPLLKRFFRTIFIGKNLYRFDTWIVHTAVHLESVKWRHLARHFTKQTRSRTEFLMHGAGMNKSYRFKRGVRQLVILYCR